MRVDDVFRLCQADAVSFADSVRTAGHLIELAEQLFLIPRCDAPSVVLHCYLQHAVRCLQRYFYVHSVVRVLQGILYQVSDDIVYIPAVGLDLHVLRLSVFYLDGVRFGAVEGIHAVFHYFCQMWDVRFLLFQYQPLPVLAYGD